MAFRRKPKMTAMRILALELGAVSPQWLGMIDVDRDGTQGEFRLDAMPDDVLAAAIKATAARL